MLLFNILQLFVELFSFYEICSGGQGLFCCFDISTLSLTKSVELFLHYSQLHIFLKCTISCLSFFNIKKSHFNSHVITVSSS